MNSILTTSLLLTAFVTTTMKSAASLHSYVSTSLQSSDDVLVDDGIYDQGPSHDDESADEDLEHESSFYAAETEDEEHVAALEAEEPEIVEAVEPGHEYRLLKDLMTEYDQAARPARTTSDVVSVKMGVALFQIRDLDEKNQFLQINAWFQFLWTDPHLAWNASAYGGQAKVHIPSSRIWVPDVVLYNSVDETKPATQIFPETHAIVSSKGSVLWVIPAMTKSSCKIDVTYFPFDEQRCPLKFGSWTYDGFQLDLINISESGDLSKYTASGEWDLIGMPARSVVLVRPVAALCNYCSKCLMQLVARPLTQLLIKCNCHAFYGAIAAFCVIGNRELSVVVVFCLPPESGEKVSLSVTVLLAMTVYQLLIVETIPATSEVIPLIGQFFGVTLVLLSISSAMTVVVMKLHFKGEHGDRVPDIVRKLAFDWIARLVGMTIAIPDMTDCKLKMTEVVYPSSENNRRLLSGRGRSGSSLHLNRSSSNNDGKLNCGNTGSSSGTELLLIHKNPHVDGNLDLGAPSCGSPYQRRPVCARKRQQVVHDTVDLLDRPENFNTLSDLSTLIGQISADLKRNYRTAQNEESRKSEWRKVALVLDRLLLMTFFVVTCGACGVIFANVPR